MMNEAQKIEQRAQAYEQAVRHTDDLVQLVGLREDAPVTAYRKAGYWAELFCVPVAQVSNWSKRRKHFTGRVVGESGRVHEWALTVKGAIELLAYLDSPAYKEYQARFHKGRAKLALDAGQGSLELQDAAPASSAEPVPGNGTSAKLSMVMDRVDKLTDIVAQLAAMVSQRVS